MLLLKVLYFHLAQAKIAVCRSRKRKLDGLKVNDGNALFLFKTLVISSVKFDFTFSSVIERLLQFEAKQRVSEVICKVLENCFYPVGCST